MSQNWYYARGNQQLGPVTIDQLKELIRSGQVQTSDLVWAEGMANWATADSVTELMPPPAVGAPVPQPPAAQPTYVNPAPVMPQQPAYTSPSPAAPMASTYSPSPYASAPVVNAPPWGTTPGGVISYGPSVQYGSFGTRLVAWIIDLVITGTAGGMVSGVLIAAIGIAGNDPNAQGAGFFISQLAVLVLYWLYFALMESSATQGTLGKMAMGLKVTNLDGGRIGFGQATGRYFAKFLSWIIAGVGYLMMLWTERKQTLHDTLAGTLVLKKTP